MTRTPPVPAAERQLGMSLVETMLVVLVMAILSAMIVSSIQRFTSAQAFSEGQAKIHEVGDKVIRTITDDVTFATHTFARQTHAGAYLAACDLALISPVAAIAAPALTNTGYFEADTTGNETTGNYLFMGRAEPTITLDMSGDGTDQVRLDLNRLILYVLVRNDDDALDLARWMSKPLIRLNDIVRIADPIRRVAVGMKLSAAGYRVAWEPGKSIAEGLFVITVTGALRAFGAGDSIDADAELVRPVMLQANRMAIAANGQLEQVPVPRYAVANGDFPGGFEVKADGTVAGRMVLVRLVLTALVRGSHRNTVDLSRIVNTRCSN